MLLRPLTSISKLRLSPIRTHKLLTRNHSSTSTPTTTPTQRSTMGTRYISPDELAVIIKSDKVLHKDYFIVDVRDDDYDGGNIKGAHNSPSYVFLSKVDALVEQTKDVPVIVFHCALSQVRGPKAARVSLETAQKTYDLFIDTTSYQIYAQTRALLSYEDKDHTPHEVLILRGGFTDFQAKFRNDPELVENWDKEVWGSEWAP